MYRLVQKRLHFFGGLGQGPAALTYRFGEAFRPDNGEKPGVISVIIRAGDANQLTLSYHTVDAPSAVRSPTQGGMIIVLIKFSRQFPNRPPSWKRAYGSRAISRAAPISGPRPVLGVCLGFDQFLTGPVVYQHLSDIRDSGQDSWGQGVNVVGQGFSIL